MLPRNRQSQCDPLPTLDLRHRQLQYDDAFQCIKVHKLSMFELYTKQVVIIKSKASRLIFQFGTKQSYIKLQVMLEGVLSFMCHSSLICWHAAMHMHSFQSTSFFNEKRTCGLLLSYTFKAMKDSTTTLLFHSREIGS